MTMSIFGNQNVKVTRIPLVESFDSDMAAYEMLRSIEESGFQISMEHRKDTYTGIKYNNIEILQESLTDFFKKAAEFFRTLITKILEFAKKTMKFFLSYFQDFEKFLKKNEDFIRGLKPAFTYKGYNYQFPKVPVLTKVYDIAQSYNIEINRIDSMTHKDVSDMRDTFYNSSHRNKIRASILDISGEISQDKFAEESKLIFRGSRDPEPINVNSTYIDKIFNEYSEIKNLLNATDAEKNRIIKLLTDFEIFFKNKAAVVYDKGQKVIRTNTIRHDDDRFSRGNSTSLSYDDDKLKIMNAYFDLKYQESRLISNCVITVYVDKVNALKDCLKQYRDIIRGAMRNKDQSEKASSVNTETK